MQQQMLSHLFCTPKGILFDIKSPNKSMGREGGGGGGESWKMAATRFTDLKKKQTKGIQSWMILL